MTDAPFAPPPWATTCRQARYAKGAAARSGRLAANAPGFRRCLGLGCGEKFKSTGWGHRICNRCRANPRHGYEESQQP